VRVTLAYLRKLTLEPKAVTPSDVRAVLAAGVSREQVRDATYVCYLFSTYDRLADALGWHVPQAKAFEVSAKHLLRRGYR
jgi:alkylhydroperoxidase family enzyme